MSFSKKHTLRNVEIRSIQTKFFEFEVLIILMSHPGDML